MYALTRLRPPDGVAGRLRRAVDDDGDLLVAWMEGFEVDTGGAAVAPDALRRRITGGLVWIWDDDVPVSMAALTPPLAGVTRVGPVYTPPEHRGTATARRAPRPSARSGSTAAPTVACCTRSSPIRNRTPSTAASATNRSRRRSTTGSGDKSSAWLISAQTPKRRATSWRSSTSRPRRSTHARPRRRGSTRPGSHESTRPRTGPTEPGQRHYLVRDGSLVAWSVPSAAEPTTPFRIVGAHTDSPNLRVKPHPDVERAGCATARRRGLRRRALQLLARS